VSTCTPRCARHSLALASQLLVAAPTMADTIHSFHLFAHSFIQFVRSRMLRCSKIPRTCHFQSGCSPICMLCYRRSALLCAALRSLPSVCTAGGLYSPPASLQARQRIYAPIDRHGMRRRRQLERERLRTAASRFGHDPPWLSGLAVGTTGSMHGDGN
jgi:hypothetical protein